MATMIGTDKQDSIGIRLFRMLFAICVGSAVTWGLMNRNRYFISPEYGIGYTLGIVGGVMMLIMLTYSLRKRLRWFYSLGNIRYWFNMHKTLGVLGPVVILFHAGFGLGSTNSNVALACMLVVSISGLIGRYIYTKIYNVYSCKLEEVEGLRKRATRARYRCAEIFSENTTTYSELGKLEESVMKSPAGFFGSLLFAWRINMTTGSVCRSAMKEARRIRKSKSDGSGAGESNRRESLYEIRKLLLEHSRLINRAA